MKPTFFVCVQALAIAACGGAAQQAPRSAVPGTTPSSAALTAGANVGADEESAEVPLRRTDPAWGSRTAPVTIVEFADFQCPFCARAEPALARIREKYGPERVRFVWKNAPLPFHPNAKPAAEAGAGVYALGGADAFWRFHDDALRGQATLTEDAFAMWARAAGVDEAALRAGLQAHTWAPSVDADVAAARKLGASGTPWFFVNGVRLVGAQPEDAFRTVIDAQLLAAEKKIASGVAPDRVYGVLAKENFKPEDEDDDDPPADAKTVFKVPIGASPTRGSADAPVTIVEFADYQCPYCGRAEATLRELRAHYGDELRIVVKNEPLPFHPHAEPAAEAALEVRAEKGNNGFWAMHDALFAHQADLSDDVLVRLAVEAGAQESRVRDAIAKHRYAKAIEADGDMADDLGADGTPHFFVNGRSLAGAQPAAKFATLIDQEILKAQALVRTGTKAEDVYETLMKSAAGPPEPERKDLGGMPAGDPARGAARPRVIVHEFADFQCPYCVRAEATVREIVKSYPNDVRLVWHDLPLPFHENAVPAARAAREAQAQKGDAAFWNLHDRFLVDDAKLARADLDEGARALGLDMAKWSASFENASHQAAIDADRDAAQAIDLNGTPTFVIAAAGAKGGYVLVGAQSAAKFRKLVERAIAEAK